MLLQDQEDLVVNVSLDETAARGLNYRDSGGTFTIPEHTMGAVFYWNYVLEEAERNELMEHQKTRYPAGT